MGLGKLLKKVGRGVAATVTLGGSELAAKGIKAKKASNAVKKAAGIQADLGYQNEQINRSEAEMNRLLGEQPGRLSNMNSAESLALKNEAYGTGPLAEYTAMRGQQKSAYEQGGRRRSQELSDTLQNQSAVQGGAQANAYSQLAQGGGITGGARERIASGLGQQSMLNAQQARLQTQRAGEDATSAYDQGQLDLTAKEASDRRGMQNAYLSMQGADVAGQNQFAQDQYGRKLEVGTGLAKARIDAGSNAYNQGKR